MARRQFATSVRGEAQRPLLRVADAARGLCRVALLVALACLPPVAAAGESDPPGPEAAMQAYQQVVQAQSAWSQEVAQNLSDPPGTTGVCLTLRENGKVIGRAEVMADDGAALRQAMEQVMAQAKPPRTVEGVGVIPRAIDVQFAGPLIPLAGDTFASASIVVPQGLEGVAARVGDRLGAAFPAVILATDSSVERALRVACARAEAPPMELNELRKQVDVRIYRFKVTHIAMASDTSAPMFLTRGGRLVDEAAVNTQSIRAFADGMASHLMRSMWPGEEPFGLMGPYRAARDEYEPFVAEPHAQALAALALARYARTPGVDPQLAKAARRTAWDVLFDITVVQPPELDPMGDTAALGLWLAAWSEARQQGIPIGISEEELAKFADRAASACSAALRGEQPVDEQAMITRAIAVYGLTMAKPHLPTVEHAPVEVELDRLFNETPPGQLVALMPWLGWATMANAHDDGSVDHDSALNVLRDVIWDHQVLAMDAGNERDLIGGTVFTRARQPLPTWQSAKPLALLATMFGDERFTPKERVIDELPKLARGLRFLKQLSVSDAEAHMYPNPGRSLGGVRKALWDQTVTADATALSLLTACETLTAVSSP
ncbi:MAG: hypothetical protein KDA20_00125 [Phycisphaerales bacterium]|nr:hypothetical protein [Phycisphaerales bacterium]